MSTITVHVVTAKNGDGVTVELAKFFEASHAEAHIKKMASARGWSDAKMTARVERADAQHESHQTTSLDPHEEG